MSLLIANIVQSNVLKRFKRVLKIVLIASISLIVIGTLYVNMMSENDGIPIPVLGANSKSWDAKSYWYSPWGKSKVHKGIDIFAPQKTLIKSPINGIVLSSSYSENGGNYLYIIGPKFRVYYFAHLNTKGVSSLSFVKKGAQIGTVGNSGNAIGAPYHLHFSIFSLFPIIRNYSSKQALGWMKMFYLDPLKSLNIT